MFMKDECYTEYKHARCINSRTDAFKSYVGPFFHLVEEQLYSHPAFIKHVPVAARPKFIKEAIQAVGATYVATDYTAFESLFTALVMSVCEFQLYGYMSQYIPDHEELMRVITSALAGINICQNKFFSVKVPATRMSGDMCTSLGNSFTNLMLMLFVCHEKGSVALGFVEGDDGLFRIKGEIPSAEDFARLGFRIKLEIHLDLCKASFCGIIFDDCDLQNICDPIKVLCRFGWTTRQYSGAAPRTLMKLLRCKALSYGSQYPGCPIVGALARYGLRVTRSYDVSHFVKENRVFNYWEREKLLKSLTFKEKDLVAPGMRTRLLMEEKFQVPVSMQIKIENYLDSLDHLQPLEIPYLDIVASADYSHYYDHFVQPSNVPFFIGPHTAKAC